MGLGYQMLLEVQRLLPPRLDQMLLQSQEYPGRQMLPDHQGLLRGLLHLGPLGVLQLPRTLEVLVDQAFHLAPLIQSLRHCPADLVVRLRPAAPKAPVVQSVQERPPVRWHQQVPMVLRPQCYQRTPQSLAARELPCLQCYPMLLVAQLTLEGQQDPGPHSVPEHLWLRLVPLRPVLLRAL